MAGPAQRAGAQQAPPYFLEVRIPGKGLLTQSSNIQLCKDRSYQMHVTARQQNPAESLVPNSRITVLGASRGMISPPISFTSSDRPYAPAVFSYKGLDEGVETLRFTADIGQGFSAVQVVSTVSFAVRDCAPTVQLIFRGVGIVYTGRTAVAQYFATMDPVELVPIGEDTYHGTGKLVFWQLTAQGEGCTAVGTAAPAPVDITARFLTEELLSFTFIFTPAPGSLTTSGACTAFTAPFSLDFGATTAFSQVSGPGRGGTMNVPIASQPHPVLTVTGTMSVIVISAR
jgi:hypothetical protein